MPVATETITSVPKTKNMSYRSRPVRRVAADTTLLGLRMEIHLTEVPKPIKLLKRNTGPILRAYAPVTAAAIAVELRFFGENHGSVSSSMSSSPTAIDCDEEKGAKKRRTARYVPKYEGAVR